MSAEDPIYVLGNRVQLKQAPGGFRTSLDSVMLAAACPAESGDHILDLGCGVGSAGLCVLLRVPSARLTGFDIQLDHVLLAQENAVLNNIKNCDFICDDIKKISSTSPRRRPGSTHQHLEYGIVDSGLRRNDKILFDHVICNPPYLEAGTHMASPSAPRAKALGHEDEETGLQDWIDAGFRSLKNGGSFTIIHRADMSDKIIQGLGKRFGAVEIIPLWPRAGEAAKRVIIRCLKNRKTPAVLHAGLVLHEADGGYTSAADDILRNMKNI